MERRAGVSGGRDPDDLTGEGVKMIRYMLMSSAIINRRAFIAASSAFAVAPSRGEAARAEAQFS